MDVVHQVEGLLFDVELDRLRQILEHQLPGLNHVFRLSIVVAFLIKVPVIDLRFAYIVFFLFFERTEVCMLVKFGEDALVLKDFEGAHSRIAAVF